MEQHDPQAPSLTWGPGNPAGLLQTPWAVGGQCGVLG